MAALIHSMPIHQLRAEACDQGRICYADGHVPVDPSEWELLGIYRAELDERRCPAAA